MKLINSFLKIKTYIREHAGEQNTSAEIHLKTNTNTEEKVFPDSQFIKTRKVRVFISSTFKDMIEERNLLMTHTWPELKKICNEIKVEFVDVDLRWGISEDQSNRKETLKLCLDEIKSCQPFFVGLLGERYGWIPNEDSFTDDLIEEQPWLKDLNGKSATELEILYGVLNNPELASRAFFYFRDPNYILSVPEDKKIDFLPESPLTVDKQNALKNLIRSTCKLNHISLIENYSDPRSLAIKILEQLKKAISKLFPIDNISDYYDKEAYDHEVFAALHKRTYISRPYYFNTLDKHCENGSNPILIIGDSGSGKSALIANWIAHWKTTHSEDFIFQHYIGGTSASSNQWIIMSRLMVEIKKWNNDKDEVPKTEDSILREFNSWLFKAKIKAEKEKVRFIVILDAINNLENIRNVQTMGWLPIEMFKENLLLILTTSPGPILKYLANREMFSVIQIERLTIDEREKMIIEYLKKFGKSLDGKNVERISKNQATSNPLYLKILLDELRVTGTYKKLNERLNNYLKANDIPSLLRNVLERYQNDYEFDRKGLVSETLGSIWCARKGLSETELMHLLKPDNMPQLPAAIWSPLRAALEESLINRGGILDFANDFFRNSVETYILSKRDFKDNLRNRLADYFEAQPITSRTCLELPFLLDQLKFYYRLRSILLNIDCFLEIYLRDAEELKACWVILGEKESIGQSYINSFNRWRKNKTVDEFSYAAFELGNFLKDISLYSDAEYLFQQAIEIVENYYGKESFQLVHLLNSLAILLNTTNRINEAEQLFRRVISIREKQLGRDHPEIASYHNNLAQVLKYSSRRNEAEFHLKRGLEINGKFYGRNHGMFGIALFNFARFLQESKQINEAYVMFNESFEILYNYFGKDHPTVANCLCSLAEILQYSNQFDEAEPLLRRALEINENSFGKDHPDVSICLNNLSILLQRTKRYNEAEPLLRRAIKIDQNSFGKNHINVAIRLNNLAKLLQSTDRFDEAEALCGRHVEIFIDFMRKTGHIHPYFNMAIENYKELLEDMQWSKEQIYQQFIKRGWDDFY